MKKIGIIGLGLIGGSIARAVKKYNPSIAVAALNRRETSLKQALDDNIIDMYSTSDFSIFAGCDIIFLCTPVDRIPGFVAKLSPFIDKNCVLTDVGSTKEKIYTKMSEYKDITFIGGHPMAGSEKIGYSHSSPDLLKNAVYILTPFDTTPKESMDKLLKVIEILGAKPVVLNASYHDKLVSYTSHTAHVISSALINAVSAAEKEDNYIHLLAAGGFRDTTRIAASSPDMWTSICLENKTEILNTISEFKNHLLEFESYLLNDNQEEISNFFTSAKEYRDSFDFSRLSHNPLLFHRKHERKPKNDKRNYNKKINKHFSHRSR